MRIVSPSLLAADFGNLERDTKMVHNSDAQWIHIDVMDGCFVPNISYGFPILEAVRGYSDKVMDVHLMITEPERYLTRFVESGADIVTFHLEATQQPLVCIEMVKNAGAKVGVSIKPNTPVEALNGLLNRVDLILVMSVEPGFGGQSFIEGSTEKVKRLSQMIDKAIAEGETRPLIEVDGGISVSNALELFTAGADAVVVGSSVFSKEDPQAEIAKIMNV
ncbi:MAG: ribulose-phosphate 3-epimerase [Rikenellaceae bacterium]